MLKDLIGQRIDITALPKAISMVLLVFAAIQAAGIAKMLFESASSASALPLPLREAAQGDIPMLDLKAIQQAELFGSLAPAPVQKPLVALLKSRLDVKLLGIAKSAQGNASVAILDEAGRQRAYAVGERLSANGSARLAEILAERVVLEVSGQRQYVELEKPAMSEAGISIVPTTSFQTSLPLQREGAVAAGAGIRGTTRRSERRRDGEIAP